MDDNGTKGLCLALIFLDTLIFGWPSYFLVRRGNQTSRSIRIRTIVISYLTCFAGGVFLGACLLHLLAEGREVMEDYFNSVGQPDTDFPIYEAVVAGGFFAIAFVEQIAHILLHNSRHGRNQETPEGLVAARSSMDGGSISMKSRTQAAPDQDLGLDNAAFTKHPNGQSESVIDIIKSDKQVVAKLSSGVSNGSEYKNDSPYASINTKESDVRTVVASGTFQKQQSQDGLINHDHNSNDDHDAEIVQMIQVMEVHPLRAFLLLGALSFHTIFDGLAIGLQDGQTDIWEMFTAICIHKSLVAVCLGLQLFLAFKSRPILGFIWVFVFSLIAPIGIGMGMGLTSGDINSDGEDLTNWILQGLATGTFLYVTIFEILREEFAQRGSLLKILVAIVGFAGMAVAKYFDKD